MKNILTFLLVLVSTFSFGQDIFVTQNWKEDVSNSQVGDTITLQLQWIDVMEDVLDPNPTLIQIDWEYNSDLLQLDSHQFIATDNSSANKDFNSWLNYNFTPKDGKTEDDLSGQYELGLTYPSTQGWGINRITMQDSGEIIGNTGNGDKILIEVKYIIKDIAATNYTTYDDLVRLNWAQFEDNRNGETYSVFADPLTLSLENVAGSPAGTVTFKLQTPNAVNGGDYMIVIEPLEQHNSTEPIDNYIYFEGVLNTSGEFITTELKQDVPYIFNVFIKSEWDQANDRPNYPQWLDDVVTVSDVMQVFKQAIGTEPDGTGNHFEYNIQKRLANVKQEGPNDPVDFDDSYILLAHIAGILENGADFSNSNNQDMEFYPITSFNNGAMNTSGFFDTFGTPITSEEEWLASRTFTLTDDQPITFNVAHGLMGDADLSHSTTPNLNDDTKIQAMTISRARRGMNILKSLPQETIDLDVVSQLVNGKVVVDINLSKDDLSGMQFNIKYDKSILTFDNITFDTGNTMSNFAKHFDDGRINFGTINLEEEHIKEGVPFKLFFTPKVSIQNTVGLVNFRVTDAVKNDGTKVNLNIQ